jgi:hypothetical protein
MERCKVVRGESDAMELRLQCEGLARADEVIE